MSKQKCVEMLRYVQASQERPDQSFMKSHE